MPITINGSGSLTGISAGGLPDDCITTAEIAAAAVTTAKLGTNEASGLAKAWVNFNGTAATIRASFNVSSLTKSSAGIYYVNFTTALADVNYSVAASALNAGSYPATLGAYQAARTTSQVPISTTNNGATQTWADNDCINVAIFR